ncbi:MAG: serine/threonine-protein phosphatase [Planctomycetaceae bacterium]|nr:serine/threonine-protein phosphatase [Planctomycetaceae bacterium]
MSVDELFIDVHHHACRKWNQNVCGDAFASKRFDNEGRLIAVLSDGLGSGVKANILACMTAQMALRFVAAGTDLLRSCEVMMESLPVCQVRKISYATFSIVDCDMEGMTRVVEEGNPDCIVMRRDIPDDVPARIMTSRMFPDRHMRITETSMQPGDRLIVCSDGVTQSGTGTMAYPLGWRREGLKDFLVETVRGDRLISSRDLSRSVVEAAMALEPNFQPNDDTSCLVMYFRKPRRLMVLTGPPYDPDRDGECAAVLDEFQGRRAICGGTTANLIAREWGAYLETELPARGATLPPCSAMTGVDLVTEGVLTLTQVARRVEAREALGNGDPADRLMDLLLDSDTIDFLVGTRINEAHQDPTLPLDLEIRRNVVRRIATALSENYLKKTSIRFI